MRTTTKLVLALTLMASGRAMTLAFIARAGNGGPGDPPDAWLMPLIGDAAVGVSAIAIAALVWRRRTMWAWVAAIVWTSIGAFDAMAAFFIERTTPWPEFFMLRAFGVSMFFAATAMHLVILALLTHRDTRADFGVPSFDAAQPRAAA